MAKSNSGKYRNLDYILLGRPGKRRWHKRHQMEPTERIEGGLAALNSASALDNRNRREAYLLKKAIQSHDKDEKRRGLVRGISYGAIVGTATGLVLWGMARGYKGRNRDTLQKAASDLAAAFEKRSTVMKDAVEGVAQVGQTITGEELKVFGADVANDRRTGAFKLRKGAKSIKHGFLEMAGGEVRVGAKKRVTIRKSQVAGSNVDKEAFAGDYIFKTKRPLRADVDAAHEQLKQIAQHDAEIQQAAKQIKALIKRKKGQKPGEYEQALDRIIKYVESTNLNEILHDPSSVGHLAAKDEAFLNDMIQVSGGKIFKNGKMRSADQVFREYLEKTSYGNNRLIDKGKTVDLRLSEEDSRNMVRGLRDDLSAMFFDSKERASYFLRNGTARPSAEFKPRDISHITAKARAKGVSGFDIEENEIDELTRVKAPRMKPQTTFIPEAGSKVKGKQRQVISTRDRNRNDFVRVSKSPAGFDALKYEGNVAQRLGDANTNRKAPIFPEGMGKKEKARRIAGAIREALRLDASKQTENLAAVGAAGVGAALVTAHQAAGLSSTASRSINDKFDRRSEQRRKDIEIALYRERMKAMREANGNRGISQAKLAADVSRILATQAESPNVSYRLRNPMKDSIRRSLNINRINEGKRTAQRG